MKYVSVRRALCPAFTLVELLVVVVIVALLVGLMVPEMAGVRRAGVAPPDLYNHPGRAMAHPADAARPAANRRTRLDRWRVRSAAWAEPVRSTKSNAPGNAGGPIHRGRTSGCAPRWVRAVGACGALPISDTWP